MIECPKCSRIFDSEAVSKSYAESELALHLLIEHGDRELSRVWDDAAEIDRQMELKLLWDGIKGDWE